jgi:hypothetical protein
MMTDGFLGNLITFISSIDYVELNGKVTVNYELERMWKEAAKAFLKGLSQQEC